MNEMKLIKMKLSDLKPLERNVRRHTEKQIEELIKSVQQFGQTRAIVIDEENNILIGNGLYFALQKMGVEEAQCYIKAGLTEIQKKKLILSDNKIYTIGVDDYDEIRNFINDIIVTGDFEIAGFDQYVLESITMTDEENEQALNDYGKITDVKYTESREDLHSTNPVQEGTHEEKKAVIVTEAEVSSSRKHIICPSCGEVIYID